MTDLGEKREEGSEGFYPRYQQAVETVGRRWSRVVLRAMLAENSRFGEIQEAIPDLSNRMLSERLRELEVEGIAERTVLPEWQVRVEYRLTEKGWALNTVVDGLSRWAKAWIEPEESGQDRKRPAGSA